MEWLFLLLPWWGFFHLLITFCFYNWHKIIHLKSLTIVLICNTTFIQRGDTMAKESTMQLRMDSDMKERVEALFLSMGTSFAEGIRMFAAQSLRVNGLPFQLTAPKEEKRASVTDLAGSLRSYATPEKLAGEAEALHQSVAVE